ncbi:RNAseH domain-containing protein [Actinomadura terrae]|uniref:RNAseH domain-containing protein n=1 Tax=Actinomadura terrae TaxID=604353 RepID=UPI001FA7FEF7|nr:RNAseH domain-containing protein [Actinomadura terrae]
MRSYALDRPAWLVGVHIRRQNPTAARARPLLVTVLVAVHADPDPSRPWTMHMYVPGAGWRPHAQGLAAFHASAIGAEAGRDAFANARDLVDQALGALPDRDEDPVLVMIDADASRRVWSGLSDARLAAGALPGDGLPEARDIAVVRICSDDTEIPRPVHKAAGGKRSADPGQPAKPDGRLYVHEGDDGRRSWMLGRTSTTYESGIVGRAGALYTRFTLPPEKKSLQGKPWHSFTGTEFVVVRSGRFSEETAAVIAARLCAQPVSWRGRTRWPVPLHLARVADMDHPHYRVDEEPDVAPG